MSTSITSTHERTAHGVTRAAARWTGVAYVALAIAGAGGFLLVRSQLHVPDDAAATLANLTTRPGLARLGLAADLTIVVAQALAAVGFARVLRDDHRTAAGATGAFGIVNAVLILVATACSGMALAVAGDPSLAPAGDQAATVQLLYGLNGTLWEVAGLFFGLWLVPMGLAVIAGGRMPRLLGRLLVAGGVGYVLSAYVSQVVPNAPTALVDGLAGIATVGEFWMIGALLAGAGHARDDRSAAA